MGVYYRNLKCFNPWQLYFSSKFNVSQCDKSLAAGFIPINTWQQRASLPFKPAQGQRRRADVLWRTDQTISITIKYAPISYLTSDNRKQSEHSKKADHI